MAQRTAAEVQPSRGAPAAGRPKRAPRRRPGSPRDDLTEHVADGERPEARDPHSTSMITSVTTVPTNADERDGREPVLGLAHGVQDRGDRREEGHRREDVQVEHRGVVARAVEARTRDARPAPANTTSRIDSAIPARRSRPAPHRPAAGCDASRRVAGLQVGRHQGGHDPARQHARQGRRQHQRDEQRVELPRQADLRGDEQLANDADDLHDDRGAGQDQGRPPDRPERRLSPRARSGHAGGARLRRGLGARPARGTRRRSARCPRRTARRPRSRAPRARARCRPGSRGCRPAAPARRCGSTGSPSGLGDGGEQVEQAVRDRRRRRCRSDPADWSPRRASSVRLTTLST